MTFIMILCIEMKHNLLLLIFIYETECIYIHFENFWCSILGTELEIGVDNQRLRELEFRLGQLEKERSRRWI